MMVIEFSWNNHNIDFSKYPNFILLLLRQRSDNFFSKKSRGYPPFLLENEWNFDFRFGTTTFNEGSVQSNCFWIEEEEEHLFLY